MSVLRFVVEKVRRRNSHKSALPDGSGARLARRRRAVKQGAAMCRLSEGLRETLVVRFAA
jgi:hypothetical protein